MLEVALGFFIALIVIISFTGLVFLYPLTFRVSVSTGHLALHTAVPDDEEAEEAHKEAKKESEVFEYVEAVQIRAVNAKDLRLRAEAMARIHSRLNCYVVFGLGQRRMRTAISLDNNSPEFGETFFVMVDRDFEASQLLSMQVYHHSLHPSESDVRLGIAFFSLAGMKTGDNAEWTPVLGGAGEHEAGLVKIMISMLRVPKQKALAMEVRSFKLQGFTAWPASGGFVSLATSMVRDPKWEEILRTLQPQLHAAVMARLDSPHRIMLLLQGSPVLYAFGMVSSGGTMVTVRRAHDAEDALADGAHITPRTAFLEIAIDKKSPDRIDLAQVLSGQRAKTLFQAAFQRPLNIDAETTELLHKSGAQPLDWWLQNFANAINIALTSSQYTSLHAHRQRETKRLMQIAADQAMLAQEADEEGLTLRGAATSAATMAADAMDVAGEILGSFGGMLGGGQHPKQLARGAMGSLRNMNKSSPNLLHIDDDSDVSGPISRSRAFGRRSFSAAAGLYAAPKEQQSEATDGSVRVVEFKRTPLGLGLTLDDLTNTVVSISPDSQAKREGFAVGDRLLSFNGRPLRDGGLPFLAQLDAVRVGDKLRIEVESVRVPSAGAGNPNPYPNPNPHPNPNPNLSSSPNPNTSPARSPSPNH